MFLNLCLKPPYTEYHLWVTCLPQTQLNEISATGMPLTSYIGNTGLEGGVSITVYWPRLPGVTEQITSNVCVRDTEDICAAGPVSLSLLGCAAGREE